MHTRKICRAAANGVFALSLSLSLAVLSGLAGPALGQQPEASPQLRFHIERFQLEGNTLLAPEHVARLLAPFTGQQKDFSDVQRALETIEVAYRDLGYGAVQVNLPEQNIGDGAVLIRIVEPRLGRVSVDGAERYPEVNIRRSVPALREGQIPNSKQIARNLLLANEHPARQTTVLMRGGETDDQVEATIKVIEAKPWKASFSFDNTGTATTGDYRVSTGYQHANMFNRDHTMTLQFITSPNNVSGVQVYGVGYHVPLYDWGGSLDVVIGYSNVNTGTLQNLLSISGSGTVGGLRYNQNLAKLGDYEQKLIVGLDYKAFQSQVISDGQSLVPDITLHPVSLSYTGTLRREGSEAGFYLSWVQNVFPGGNDGANSDFQGPTPLFPTGSRADARAGYRVYRFGANFSKALPKDWQLRATMTGQHSDHALVAGEQFGIGGAENLRGFLEREVANDRGYRASVEMHTPNLGAVFAWTDVQSRLLAFYDWGTVSRNSVQPGESPGQSLASAGVGLRLSGGKNFSLRSDFAQVLDGGGAQTNGHKRLHFSLSLVF